MKRWKLAQRMMALISVVGLGVLTSLLVLVVLTTRNEMVAENLLMRVSPAHRDAGELVNALLAQETALRGYALTGDARLREAHRMARNHEDHLAEELRVSLPQVDPTALEELNKLLASRAAWQTQAVEPMVMAVARDGPGSIGESMYLQEARLFAPVLASAKRLDYQLNRQQDMMVAELRMSRQAELIALISGGILAILAGTGVLLILRHWVIRPVAQLARDARQVADGDHEHQVSVPSEPPELAEMATDVERMRSRIVSELAKLARSQRELQETQERLRNQAVDLMRSNRDLEQFAYVASHDLQEPLRKVSGFCELLQRRYANQLDERAQRYIQFAVDGAQRMQQLISALLAFSRVGRSEAAFAEVSMTDVVNEALAELDSDERTEARIVVDELPRVYGDHRLLRQLMTNLIGNALKFRRPNTPLEVHINVVRDDLDWQFSVADNGIGINPEFADKIFVIFQRLHSRETYPGTGIGLALAKRIIEYHGGRIWLDTERQDGATIHFTLPARSQPPARSQVHDQAHRVQHASGDQSTSRRG